jgi:hypothetical protein
MKTSVIAVLIATGVGVGVVVPHIAAATERPSCSKEEMEKCKRAAAEHGSATTPRPSDVAASRVSFYSAGLVCKAAPKIGCGSKAKPVLLALSGNSHVDGAWLDEAGTRVAIAWKPKMKPLSVDQLNAVIDPYGIVLEPVVDASRTALVTSFASNRGWYDSTSVDRLSEQEAGVIAARLVRRIAARAKVDTQQAEQLRAAFERTFRDRFTKNVSTGDMAAQLVSAAEPFVDKQTLVAVRESVDLGYRPLASEE